MRRAEPCQDLGDRFGLLAEVGNGKREVVAQIHLQSRTLEMGRTSQVLGGTRVWKGISQGSCHWDRNPTSTSQVKKEITLAPGI